ncbi:hypothetical protein CYMTET_20379 [Cymbomonas tetramitiformis]|uniref:Uncharacterized protein n=1 Tax=Cymbomonas tetramitiformis TaxID=36881 RepID=A0AAE0L3Z0_9CHLO|nr:hypothetical protein CYMTET_20379 [Cymbomonas tetramitiformis]|eukprot:gene24579-29893_t
MSSQSGTIVPKGKTRLCISGFSYSHNTGLARQIADKIADLKANEYETWFVFGVPGLSHDHYGFVDALKPKLATEEQRKKYMAREGWSAPFVWMETLGADDAVVYTAIGGCDDFRAWSKAKNFGSAEIDALCDRDPSLWGDLVVSQAPGTAEIKVDAKGREAFCGFF